jgi:hypothetical protein
MMMQSLIRRSTRIYPLHNAAHRFYQRALLSNLTKRNSDIAHTSKDGVVGLPIDFDVQSKVDGNESQIVTVELEPGQVLRAESGNSFISEDSKV